MKFSGKTFVIMGATSGVGRTLAKKLSDEGASLVLCGRNEEKLNDIASEICSDNYKIKLDVASSSFEGEFLEELSNASTALGGVKFDGGVYCSGIAPIMPLRGISRKLIDDVFAVNYTGAVVFFKVLAAKNIRSSLSSIVYVSSVSASRGEKGLGIYGASKAAMESSIRTFAKELALFNVRINCISLGWLNTKMNAENAQTAGGLLQRMKDSHPLGIGSTSDAASAISFLLSDDAKWITGTTLVVDGGYLA